MRVEYIEKQSLSNDTSHKNPAASNNGFSHTLSRTVNSHILSTQSSQKTVNIQEPTQSDNQNINLGRLSGRNKTVAQLLLANPDLKAKTWSIIHNSVNKAKAFKQIPAGSTVFFNQQTQELNWGQSIKTKLEVARQHLNITPAPETSSSLKKATNTQQAIMLGQIDKDNPTIGKLLGQQSEFKDQRWDIIHSAINKNKAFTKIPSGTEVFLDPISKELSWNSAQATKPSIESKPLLSQKLDDAVKPFMGTEYKHLDCYTLVVNGLENMGVRYRGKGSLSSQLLQRAQLDGRASNAYFTGEGLTEALGDKVYTKAITQVNNIDQQSNAVFQEMKNLMQKGDILSFSLQTKGHVGVISQNNEQWTYINSGRLDHSITDNAPRNGVGEETLFKEINNWLRLAQQKNESLQITVGRIDKQKLA